MTISLKDIDRAIKAARQDLTAREGENFLGMGYREEHNLRIKSGPNGAPPAVSLAVLYFTRDIGRETYNIAL